MSSNTTPAPAVQAEQNKHDRVVAMAGEMARRFETHTGVSWIASDWRHESALWAAAWNASLSVQPVPDATQPEAWREHVEQRLLTWRQRIVNRSGDRLALDDFMDKVSLDDLIDYVCDEWAGPQGASPAATACSGPAAPEPEVSALRVPPAGAEPAPANSLPTWDECSLRVHNSDFIAKRIAEGGYGPEPDSELATQLHRFIYEYDDADPYRSAWFRNRLELLLDEVSARGRDPEGANPEGMSAEGIEPGGEATRPDESSAEQTAQLPQAEPSDAEDAERYRYLRHHRPVLLLTAFFGNGCVNQRIEEVDAAIDTARAALKQQEQTR